MRGRAGGMDGVGLVWVGMGVWWRGVVKLGSFFIFHFYLRVFFCIGLDPSFLLLSALWKRSDRHTNAFPAALLFLL